MRQVLTPEGVTRDKLGAPQVMLAGGVAGVSSWFICIVPDTVKSRLQTGRSEQVLCVPAEVLVSIRQVLG